jgi:hypothetical protein
MTENFVDLSEVRLNVSGPNGTSFSIKPNETGMMQFDLTMAGIPVLTACFLMTWSPTEDQTDLGIELVFLDINESEVDADVPILYLGEA